MSDYTGAAPFLNAEREQTRKGPEMAGKSRASFNKTNIARAKREKRQEKMQRKLERRQEARDRRAGKIAEKETRGIEN